MRAAVDAGSWIRHATLQAGSHGCSPTYCNHTCKRSTRQKRMPFVFRSSLLASHTTAGNTLPQRIHILQHRLLSLRGQRSLLGSTSHKKCEHCSPCGGLTAAAPSLRPPAGPALRPRQIPAALLPPPPAAPPPADLATRALERRLTMSMMQRVIRRFWAAWLRNGLNVASMGMMQSSWLHKNCAGLPCRL